MPRSNSSRGVAEGGSVASRTARLRRIAGLGRHCGLRIAAAIVAEIERLAGAAAAGRTTLSPCRHRLLAAAKRARRTGRIRTLARVERITTAARAGRAGARLLLNDRRGRADLRLLVIRLRSLLLLRRLLAIARGDLRGRHGRDVGLCRRLSGRTLRAALELADAILELAVAILQLFVLAGELAQLVLQPLDPHLGVAVVRLGEGGRAQREQRGERHGAVNCLEFG